MYGVGRATGMRTLATIGGNAAQAIVLSGATTALINVGRPR
jgi:hypothetical protein